MDAVTQRRAARLAALAGAAVLTFVMAVAALWTLCSSDPAPEQIAQAEPVAITPTSGEPLRGVASEPFYAAPLERTVVEAKSPRQAPLSGPQMIENPAALLAIEQEARVKAWPSEPLVYPEVTEDDFTSQQLGSTLQLVSPYPAASPAPTLTAGPTRARILTSNPAAAAPNGPPLAGGPMAAIQPRPPVAPQTDPAVAPLPDPARDAVLSYTASTNDLSRRLEPEVQAGFQLGKAGAVFAARAKFVSVLRRIALAKDAEQGSTSHTTALAEGLRTLDDADDFVPRGDALEAELDVDAIAGSHGVRLLDERVAPHEAIALYSRHAAERLAEAAAGEPAGSMALYGLGKSYARLEAQADDSTAGRKSSVMFRAAIDTHPQNYLAANELGVRLAQTGRYEQASAVLRQAAAQPTAIATVHANLAAIEQRLGHQRAAVFAQQQSEQLAQQERAAGEVSRRMGVEWVDPQAFQRATPGAAAPAMAVAGSPVPAYQPPTQPQQSESGWTGFVKMAKRATGWSKPAPVAPAPTAAPYRAPLQTSPQRAVR